MCSPQPYSSKIATARVQLVGFMNGGSLTTSTSGVIERSSYRRGIVIPSFPGRAGLLERLTKQPFSNSLETIMDRGLKGSNPIDPVDANDPPKSISESARRFLSLQPENTRRARNHAS